jgi:hypothetical protein
MFEQVASAKHQRGHSDEMSGVTVDAADLKTTLSS